MNARNAAASSDQTRHQFVAVPRQAVEVVGKAVAGRGPCAVHQVKGQETNALTSTVSTTPWGGRNVHGLAANGQRAGSHA